MVHPPREFDVINSSHQLFNTALSSGGTVWPSSHRLISCVHQVETILALSSWKILGIAQQWCASGRLKPHFPLQGHGKDICIVDTRATDIARLGFHRAGGMLCVCVCLTWPPAMGRAWMGAVETNLIQKADRWSVIYFDSTVMIQMTSLFIFTRIRLSRKASRYACEVFMFQRSSVVSTLPVEASAAWLTMQM